MARRTTSRGTPRGLIAALALLTVTTGPGVLAAPAAADATPAGNSPYGAQTSEQVFQSNRYVPRKDTPFSAGPTGYLHTQEGRSGYLWTSYATGGTTELGALDTLNLPAYLGSSSDVVADFRSGTADVVLHDMSAGTTTDIALTHGTYTAAFGTHVLTQARDTDGNRQLWLYGGGAPDGGTTVEGWPAGITANFRVLGGDGGTAVIAYTAQDGSHLLLVDLAAAKVSGDVALSQTPTQVALSADRLVWYSYGTTAHVLNRSDLSAPATTVTLPGTEGTPYLGIAGGWLVVSRSVPSNPADSTDRAGARLTAVPLAGGDAVTLLRHAGASLTAAPDGSLLAVGGTDSAHWAVSRITDPGTGSPAVTEVSTVPPVAARIARLSLQNGTLATDEADTSFMGAYYTRKIAADGTPGAATWQGWDGSGTGPYSTGDGRAVTFTADSDPAGSYVRSIDRNDDAGFFYLPSAAGAILDVTGRYAVVNGTSPARQYVGDLGVYSSLQPILTRSVTAASVWGTELWAPGTTAGTVTATDLKTRKTTATVNLGAPCTPKELQAVGRWLYWSCGLGATAGVWDRTAKRNIPVPSGEALLGDGYLVRSDPTAGALQLTAFAAGTATTRRLADLPSGAQRGAQWTVDKFGGPVAYVDADRRVHLVPSGVATQPLTAIESEATDNAWGDPTVRTDPWWQWRGLLSKPAASWKATFTSKATGAVVRTLTGGAVNGTLTTRWNLRDTAGALVPNGTYTFKLTGVPADGSGAALTVSRTVRVQSGAAVRHDYTNSASWSPDGIGDMLALSSSGVISYRPGNGSGAFNGAMSASGWPSSVTLVPLGDLDGDRQSDVLVRFSSGELRVYRTYVGQPFLTGTPHTSLGTGWNQYDVLTSPGDITGDGRPDLVARKKSTGEVFLYKGTSAGKLSSRTRIATNWSGYKKIVGVGDFNGDGRGDLLALDKSNTLWRYDGNGSGGFKARVQLVTKWGSSYNVIIGVGDITGDAKPDLVARDTSGNLWRNTGTGKGTFGARTKIGTGWQKYKGIY